MWHHAKKWKWYRNVTDGGRCASARRVWVCLGGAGCGRRLCVMVWRCFVVLIFLVFCLKLKLYLNVASRKKTKLVREHGSLLCRDMVADCRVPDHAIARLDGRGLFGRGLDNRFFRWLGLHCNHLLFHLIYLTLSLLGTSALSVLHKRELLEARPHFIYPTSCSLGISALSTPHKLHLHFIYLTPSLLGTSALSVLHKRELLEARPHFIYPTAQGS